MSALVSACVQVDIARWVINPSIEGLLRNHGKAYTANKIPLLQRPEGSTIEQERIVGEDKIVDMAVTHLMVPGQKMGLVYCGGNGFTQSNRARPIFNAFNPSPNILLFDYPGYGLSGGEATSYEFDLATKLLGAHIENWQKNNQLEKILFWGKSFGGTICARLAGHYSGNNSLVLETTYNDLYSLVNSRAGLFKHLITIHIDPDTTDFHINQSLTHYANPIAVIKSSNDPVTPPEASNKLVKLLRKQGNNVLLINRGAARHEELLFYPCKAAEIFKQLNPVSGSLKPDTSQCSAGK